MDIGFDTIIYVILGLAFVFAQVAKKKKKDAQAQLAEDEGNEVGSSPSAPSVLERLLGIPEQKPLVKKPVENFKSPAEDRERSFYQPPPSEGMTIPVNEVVKPAKKIDVKKRNVYQEHKSGKRSVFDLKQAIIYKAILERKNF